MDRARWMTMLSACLLIFGLALPVCAQDPSAVLPRYDLKLTIDTHQHVADLNLQIYWKNSATTRPTNELVVNFWPQYRIPDGDKLLLAKTLELLRLHPSYGIDIMGRHGVVSSVQLLQIQGRPASGQLLPYHYRHDLPTAIVIDLPETLNPGQDVIVEIKAQIRLPNKQGRWGYWEGIHFLVNAIPVVAFYDDQGWHQVPFVPWHQPFWNEAGIFTGTVTVPEGEKIACSALLGKEELVGNGWKQVQIKPFTGRDFAIVCSPAFQEYQSVVRLPDGRDLPIKCLAYPKHEFMARAMIQSVAEAIPIYCQWFGTFPHEQFTIVESFFGWNGNETAGMVLIDERVFNMPHLGRGYVEYLVAHETCHQWWYDLVGTNGYAETFMDEGAAVYFTHRMLDKKVGKNNNLLEWPKRLEWLPNIRRDNYRNAAVYGAIGRDEMPAAAGDLPGFNHLAGLFAGAYDRGSKIFGMIENRLGEEAFFDFTRMLVAKYSWKVLSVAQFRVELETYTGQDWSDLFDRWVYGKGLTDWKLEKVRSFPAMRNMIGGVGTSRVMEITVTQTAEYEEPTVLGISMKDGDNYPLRIPIGPGSGTVTIGNENVRVERIAPNHYTVSLNLAQEPAQITVDPDHVLLDKNPGNNSWRMKPRLSFSPVYSMLNETDLTNDYDKWNIGGGPWVGGALYPDPWYTRSTMVGLRAGAYRTQTFSGGLYSAYRTDFRDFVIGADGLFDHFPQSHMQLGYNYEQRILGPYGNVNGQATAKRGSLFARYVHQYSSSLYLPPLAYTEGFTTYQDNFFPESRATNQPGQRPQWTWMNGVHTRVNLYTPYWDPECGFWFDAAASTGLAKLDTQVNATQLRGEFAAVKKLPGDLGVFTDTRVASRVVVYGAFPQRGLFYALGGGTLFRGFDLAERQGSFLWVVNNELRLPLARNVNWDVFDHVAGARNLWLALFYDVGAIYADGKVVTNVAHALGAGIRVDTALFGFIERVTLRADVGKTINANTPFQFWFGVQHSF